MGSIKTAKTTLGEYSPSHGSPLFGSRYFYGEEGDNNRWQHLYVLPVLLMEFLALALTRAALPSMLVEQYGDHVYVVMGICDCVRGMLAFLACPLFGKISDDVGRRICLFITVLGTCAPVCSLAFFSWDVRALDGGSGSFVSDDGTTVAESSGLEPDDSSDSGGLWPLIWALAPNRDTDDAVHFEHTLHPHALPTFVILLSLSGVFSSTFTLVFAYISDTVHQQEERVSAYGLALATFGLSFTIGPLAGGYLAHSHKQYVFVASLVLTLLDLLYIYAILPESRTPRIRPRFRAEANGEASNYNISWNPVETLRIIAVDPFLRKVSKVAFLYYTGLWALISTLSVYAVKRFHLGPERLGELMSALGLCTMIAEAVLVRIMVPMFGEKKAIKIGLFSFAIQCIVLGFSYEPWHLFVCAFFSLLANLVYPSLTSLVSGSVEPSAVGEALGAVNGVKALTEGIGPLFFGTLMTLSEKSALPGWPYLLAALLVVAAYYATDELPDTGDDLDEYVHELERKKFRQDRHPILSPSGISAASGRSESPIVSVRSCSLSHRSSTSPSSPILEGFKGLLLGPRPLQLDEEDADIELEHLLSDIDEDGTNNDSSSCSQDQDG